MNNKYSQENISVHDPVSQYVIGISDTKYKERMQEYKRTDYFRNHPDQEHSIVDDYIPGECEYSKRKAKDYDQKYLEDHGSIPVQPNVNDLIVYKNEDEAIKYSLSKKGAYQIVTAGSIDEAKNLVDVEKLESQLSRNDPKKDLSSFVLDY